ncbi:MAG TPA: CarD family transcriptional regulator, partial [Pyrinomonadaceae bacterium]|nr:CarD family transcriptional regulator [Pyrinomonadaceae bacterium]
MSSAIESMPVLHGVLRRVVESAEFARLAAEVRGGARVISVSGLTSGAARALALAALQRETGKRLAIVLEANLDLETWERDLAFWSVALRHGGDTDADEGAVLTLPASEGDPYAGASPHAEILEQRALALWRLARGEGKFVLLSARALARRTLAPEQLIKSGARLRRDEDYAPEKLVEQLLASGYMRQDPVGTVGDFSLRGGILDVWSPGHDAPVRVEFFGDTVDSIREFDAETQLSVAHLKGAEIVPMRELAVGRDDFKLWAEAARERFNDERYARALLDRTVHADEGETFAGWEWLIPLVLNTESSAFDYLKDSVLVVDEPGGIEGRLGAMYDSLASRYVESEAADEIALRPDELYLTVEELRARIGSERRIEFRALGRAAAMVDERFVAEAEQPTVQIGRARRASPPLFLFPAVESAPEVEWRSLPARRYHGRIPDLAADARRAREEKAGVTLLAMPSTGMAERVREVLADYNVNARLALAGEGGAAEDSSAAAVTTGRLSGGFELPGAGLVVHIESDLFDEASDGAVERRAPSEGKSQKEKGKSRKSKTAAFLSDFRDLKVNDYVVHIDHGVARFGGLQRLNLGGRENRSGEFMLLYYAEDAKLYVPVERLDLVQRYSSAEGHEPTLERLGGLGWQKTKAKAKRAMRDMADELLRLYAERKLVGGYAFAA